MPKMESAEVVKGCAKRAGTACSAARGLARHERRPSTLARPAYCFDSEIRARRRSLSPRSACQGTRAILLDAPRDDFRPPLLGRDDYSLLED